MPSPTAPSPARRPGSRWEAPAPRQPCAGGTKNATTNLTWEGTNYFDSNLAVGRVDGVEMSIRVAEAEYYYYIFYATNAIDVDWSAELILTGK